MSRSEALSILNIDPDSYVSPLDAADQPLEETKEEQASPSEQHQLVMERFETLFEKNTMEKGSSFYIQSKIYFAKESLMQDYPAEFNISKYNPAD